MTPEEIRLLAVERGCTIKDLLALAPANDPFYAGGTPATRAAAEWFAGEVWKRFDFFDGVHLRRIHYRVISADVAIFLPDGRRYENTDESWAFLETSSKWARDCGLVDPAAFVDRKHPAPHLFAPGVPAIDTRSVLLDDDLIDWNVPGLHLDTDFRIRLPEVSVNGYEYTPAHQSFHVELWIEKSTMNDVLEPLCQSLDVNLVTAVGFQSGTNIIRLAERIRTVEKPTRVFYVSDFDPAGDAMPVATARRIEHAIERMVPGADVALKPIVLTLEQVRRYRLPRTPIKATDKRRAGFEEWFGEGAVELDALEALHPGELARIVEDAVAPYRDEDLEKRTEERSVEAADAASEAWEDALEEHVPEAEEIEAGVRSVLARRKKAVETIVRQLDADLAPWRKRIEALRSAIGESYANFAPDLPALPDPIAPGTDESEWLYSSGRDYLEQLEAYKGRRGRPDRKVA